MLNLKSWSQEHPREPLLLLVVLCSVLTGYVYTASPEPHSDHSAQAKSTVAKTLPTAGPLLVEAPVQGRRVTPVALALSDDSGSINNCTEGHHFHIHDYKLGDQWWVCRDGHWALKKEVRRNEREQEMVCNAFPLLENCPKPKPTFQPNPNDYWM